MKVGTLFVVSGSSGVGKTTLINAVIKKIKDKQRVNLVVTYTTRPAREHEQDGKDYHFISVDEFKQKIEKNDFMEWSTWYDHYYGSPASILKDLEKGVSYIAIVDRPGAKDIKQSYKDAQLIWIAPPNLQALKDRLIARGHDSKTIDYRLQKACIEMEQEKSENLYDHYLVNNDFHSSTQDCVSLIDNILNKAKKR